MPTFLFFIRNNLTELGLYLSRRSINRSSVSRKTGIRKSRLSELSNNSKTKLTVSELWLIAKAIDVEPGELLEVVCVGLELEVTSD